MAIIAQFSDTLEPIADTELEAAFNHNLYAVISGCAVTYDASDMTVDIAQGMILHNGSVVHVAAQTNAVTLSADGTNPRWSYVCLNSSGTGTLVSGTAAATPSKPELGDNVWLSAVLIEAAQTVANNISVKLDKRLIVREFTEVLSSAQTFTTNTTYADITGIKCFMGASEVWRVTMDLYMTFGGTGGFKAQLTGPAAPTAVVAQGYAVYLDDTTAYRTIKAEATATAFSSNILSGNSTNAATNYAAGVHRIIGTISNGSTAGVVQLQGAQNSSNSTSTFNIGSTARWERISA